MTTEELAVLILPYAKAHHPEKYTQTLDVSTQAKTFRRYLVRLVEIRCTEEAGWMRQVPLSVLEESAITLYCKWRGMPIEVRGRGVPGPRDWSFAELALCEAHPEMFTVLQNAKTILDLDFVDVTPTEAEKPSLYPSTHYASTAVARPR